MPFFVQVGPILGAACGAFCYSFIFNLKRGGWRKEKEVETMSMKSDEDMLDDLDRVRQYKESRSIFLFVTFKV